MTTAGADAPASIARDPGSWRDPSGFVYLRDGVLHRQIQPSFLPEWEAFLASGLHDRLVAEGRLIADETAPLEAAFDGSAGAVIRPEPVDFISYPYEWTFGELKDAALLTLDVQLEAIDAGFTLRDASAYNVQFRGAQPVLIDSLSFERLEDGAPWVAYRQACEHFLAPLSLMAYVDVRLGRLLRSHLDGIPLDLAGRLLPTRTRLRPGMAMHLHLHARSQRQHAGDASPVASPSAARPRISAVRLKALVQSLRSVVDGLDWEPAGTEWADYADQTSYDQDATAAKARVVETLLTDAGGRVVWDLGANTGRYSEIARDSAGASSPSTSTRLPPSATTAPSDATDGATRRRC